MGFVDWARAIFNRNTNTLDLDNCHYVLSVEYYYKQLAVETCVDLIANALSGCEIQTFSKGKPIRGEMYYLLNVQPNVNQSATEFFHDVVRKYVYATECLIIMQDDQLYVADEFEMTEYAFKPNMYRRVKVGELQLDKIFYEKDVIHIRVKDRNMLKVINGLYESYGKLLASSMSYYRRKNNKRLLIKGDFLRAQTKEMQESIDAMFEGQLKNWFDPDKEGTAFQLQDGYVFEDMSDSNAGALGSTDSRDINNLIDDIFNFVAMAFHVPRGLLKGDLADVEKQTDSFLMFAIKPPAELIADEFNRKMYSKQEYTDRTYLKIDTSKIKVIDIGQVATAVDKLFAIGSATINDIQEILGREPIEEEYGDYRFVTKNYERVGAQTHLKGGENE